MFWRPKKKKNKINRIGLAFASLWLADYQIHYLQEAAPEVIDLVILNLLPKTNKLYIRPL